MDDERIYLRVCKRCKSSFESSSKKAYVCPGCKRESKLANMKKSVYEQQEGLAVMGVIQRVRLIDRYNKKHDICYTYGKFDAAVRLGKISEADFD